MKIINILKLFYCKLFKKHPVVVVFQVLSHLDLTAQAPFASQQTLQHNKEYWLFQLHPTECNGNCYSSFPFHMRAPGTVNSRPFPLWEKRDSKWLPRFKIALGSLREAAIPALAWPHNFTTVIKRV